MYKKYVKRIMDILISIFAVLLLSPIIIILIISGAIAMKGNPFFVQKRPGLNENIFSLLKFRTMSNAKDKEGKLLPNELRLNKYGKLIRTTSLDELPELFNIFIGDMSIVGPRPLLPEYLPYYTEAERHRHDVRPGLTGLAQVNGRNAITSWEERFGYDIEYVNKCSIILDIKIIFQTALKVVKRADIVSGQNTEFVGRFDDIRRDAQNKGN